jgi:hypothetical protein
VIRRHRFSLPDARGWQIALWFAVSLAAAAIAGLVAHQVWPGAPRFLMLVFTLGVGMSVGDWLIGRGSDADSVLLRRRR